MALVNPDVLPLSFDAGFKDTLDIGAHNNDDKSKIFKKYELSWWSGCKPRDIDDVEILKGSTLQKCLDHYQQQLSISTAGATLPRNVRREEDCTLPHILWRTLADSKIQKNSENDGVT